MAGLLYRYGTGIWETPLPYVIACCLMAAVVLWAHRTNMKRVIQGTERKVVFPWNTRDKRDRLRLRRPEKAKVCSWLAEGAVYCLSASGRGVVW